MDFASLFGLILGVVLVVGAMVQQAGGAIGDLEWIDSDDNIPAILFHGTSDLVVPYDYGLPFTINIALPIVYGSSRIHEKLDDLGIQSEVYIEQGEPHEYWGALNGNWIGGPNEYFDQIQTDSYNFLYQFLDADSNDVPGDLNQDDVIDILDIIEVVNYILNCEYVEEADINGYGVLNILDLVRYVEIILSQ